MRKISIMVSVMIGLGSCANEPKATVEHCYNVFINSDSVRYYINIDWNGKCGRMVSENKRTTSRDTSYFGKFHCLQSEGIANEINERYEAIKH